MILVLLTLIALMLSMDLSVYLKNVSVLMVSMVTITFAFDEQVIVVTIM